MKTTVITKNYIEGFHFYKGAPDAVSFLKNRHRHIFSIECGFEVSHDDREIEIFLKQDEISNYIQGEFGVPAEFKEMSCEMIASKLINIFDCSYVKVLEDQQGGAIVQR